MLNKVVVTGASGFVGRALTRELCRREIDVLAITRPGSDKDPFDFECRTEACNVSAPEALSSFLDADTTLFHLAGHTSVAGSVRNPEVDFDGNVMAFFHVLETARASGATVIFPSSPAVFEPGQDLPLKESDRKRPVSPYGAAKLACEGYAAAFHSCYGLDVRIARIFNVYGPGMTRFAIFDFYRKLKQNAAALQILGDGSQMRDYLFINDAVEALLVIGEHGVGGEDYNVASGVPTETMALAEEVAAAMGLSGVEFSALGRSFPGDIPRWYADITKLKALGFEPTVSLVDGLKRTVEWLNDHSEVEVSLRS